MTGIATCALFSIQYNTIRRCTVQYMYPDTLIHGVLVVPSFYRCLSCMLCLSLSLSLCMRACVSVCFYVLNMSNSCVTWISTYDRMRTKYKYTITKQSQTLKSRHQLFGSMYKCWMKTEKREKNSKLIDKQNLHWNTPYVLMTNSPIFMNSWTSTARILIDPLRYGDWLSCK